MKLINNQTAGRGPQETDNEENCGPAACDEHGGNISKISRELGVAEESLIDFSASINPLGISGRVKDVIIHNLDNLVNYPDPDSKKLRQKIAEYHNIDISTIFCGNGSTELIYLIPRILKPSTVLVPAPTFSEYERACKLNYELRITNCELKEENNYQIVSGEFIRAMQGCDMAFLCNPNNPTGGLLNKEVVLEIAEAARNAECFLVLDEAFIDFISEESVIDYVKENPYVIVLRSMTKFHALTGLRIGYGIFNEKLIAKVKEFKEPWTVNNLAEKAAIAALDDREYADRTIIMMRKEKAYMENMFSELGLRFVPSAVNYYMVQVDNSGLIVRKLLRKGIIVRDCSNFKGLDSSYIRVAVKSHEHNEILIKEIAEICTA